MKPISKNILAILFVVFLCIVAYFLWVFSSENTKNPEKNQNISQASSVSGVINATKDRVNMILGDTEVQKTMERIQKDEAKYNKDGAVFVNKEKHLPIQKDRSYYSEWTVRTPGESTRGARRIIEGKGWELYFTDDHYRSFVRIR